jgi:glycosyltransferase involved in cell wall biosynthesis
MSRSILMFSLAPNYGGGEKYICDLVSNMAYVYNWHLAVCSIEIVYKLSSHNNVGSVKLIANIGGVSRVLSAVKAAYEAMRYNVDIVMLNGIAESRYAILFKLLHMKVVGIIHTLQIDSLSGWRKHQYLLSLRTCDCIISVSKQATLHYPIDIRNRTHVIYNYAPHPTIKRRRIADQIHKVLFVGRFEKLKGIEDIFKLAEKYLDVRFDILGPLDKENIGCSLAERERPNIFLRGFCTNVFDFYLNSDVFLFPSRSEGGLPLVLLEAASVGLPIIATKIPAHLELAEYISGMRLYDPGDVDQLVSCFESLIEPAAREAAGKRIYESYLEFAKSHDFAGRYRRIFDRL